MFNIGDVVIYSAHGISKIDNICEKTFSNVTKTYYELHPLKQANLMISTFEKIYSQVSSMIKVV